MMRKVLFLLLCLPLASREYKDLHKSFVLGSLEDKGKIVEEAASLNAKDKLTMGLEAMEFLLSLERSLGEDEEQDELVLKALSLFSLEGIENRLEKVNQVLGDTFRQFKASSVRQAALEHILSLLEIQKDIKSFVYSASLINAYVTDSLEQNIIEEGVMALCIKAMGVLGNASSFNILFSVLKSQKLESYNDSIVDSLCALALRNPVEVKRLLSSGKVQDKYLLFSIIVGSNDFGEEFKCQVAQTVLDDAIKSSSSEASKEAIIIQLEALRILTSNNWTRASQTVMKFFFTAKDEYRAKSLTAEQFGAVIDAIPLLSPPNAGEFLAQYLASLNEDVRAGNEADNITALSTVKALGALKDKAGFDSLLSATYLEYNSEVLKAAKAALAELKW